jgi:hypothetical protein
LTTIDRSTGAGRQETGRREGLMMLLSLLLLSISVSPVDLEQYSSPATRCVGEHAASGVCDDRQEHGRREAGDREKGGINDAPFSPSPLDLCFSCRSGAVLVTGDAVRGRARGQRRM